MWIKLLVGHQAHLVLWGQVTNRAGRMPKSNPRNPQTVALLDMLGLPYNLSVSSFQHNGAPWQAV